MYFYTVQSIDVILEFPSNLYISNIFQVSRDMYYVRTLKTYFFFFIFIDDTLRYVLSESGTVASVFVLATVCSFYRMKWFSGMTNCSYL